MDCCSSSDLATGYRFPPFYLNVVVLNKDEAVSQKLAAKVGSGILAKAISKGAAKAVSEERFGEAVASKLEELVPQALDELGIKLELEKRYQAGAFFVLRAQVIAVESMAKLVLNTRGKEFAESFDQLCDSLRSMEMEDAIGTIQTKVYAKVQEVLLTKLESTIPTKMQLQGLECTVVAKRDTEEAEYFFSQQVRNT